MSQTPLASELPGKQSSDLDTASLPPLTQRLRLRSYGSTDRGRVRPSNQDQFLIAELTKALRVQQSSLPQEKMHYGEEQAHLFLVADGMGGHAGGERASALAIDTIEGFMLNSLKWFFHLKSGEADKVLGEFQTALAQADDRLFREAARHPELQGMGTTLTLAYSLGVDLFVAHVGDSRCYLFRDGTLHRITRDHTLVGEMVRRGVLEPEQAAHHKLRHVITNAVGGPNPGVHVEVHKLQVQARDLLLLCSDGLTGMLSDDDITGILRSEADPAELCRHLTQQANERGGKDNITVIVTRYDAETPNG